MMLYFDAPVAQLDRVSGFEPLGRRFDPCRARHQIYECAGVAELADAYGLGPYGQPWGFKSLRPHHFTSVTVWT